MTGYASLIIAAGVVGGLAVVYLLGRAIIEKIVLAGKSEERANQAEADLSLAKKQGEIMTRDENREDTARSLDDSSF